MRGKLILTVLIVATAGLGCLYWTGSRQGKPPPLLPPDDRNLPLSQDDATVSSLLAQLPETTPEPAPSDEATANLTEEVPPVPSPTNGKYNNPSARVGSPGKELLVKDVVDEHIFREQPDTTDTRKVLLDDYGDWSRVFKGTVRSSLDGQPQPGDDTRRGDPQKPMRTYQQRAYRRRILSVNRLSKLLRLLNEGKDDTALQLRPDQANATIVKFAFCIRVVSSLWRSAQDSDKVASLSYFLKPGDGRGCDRLRAHDMQQCGSLFSASLMEDLSRAFFGSTTATVPMTQPAMPSSSSTTRVLLALRRVCTAFDVHPVLQRMVNETLKISPRRLPLSRVNASILTAGAQSRWPQLLSAAGDGGGAAFAGSFRQVQMPRVARKQEYMGEGVCDISKNSNVYGGGGGDGSGGSWSPDLYRLSVLMDAEDVLDMFAKDPQFSSSADVLKLLDPSHPSVACMVSVGNPAVDFMRKSRWMLDGFRPFANEFDLLGPNHEAKAFKRRPVMYRDDKPPTNDEFDLVVNRFVAGKKSFYTIKQLCGAIYYELRNVCLSPDGHGMSGFDAAGKVPQGPDELRDERRQKIRGIRIMPRRTRPKYFIDKPLVLHLVQFQSNNVGHVMYRLNMLTNLIKNFLSPNRTFDSFAAGAEEALIGLYVVPTALDTFGSSNSYKLYYQAMEMAWFSVAALNVSRRSVEEEGRDVCFRRAYLGMDTSFMYHSKGGSSVAQRKMREAAAISQALVARGLENIRNRLLRCYGMKFDINSGPQNPFVWRLEAGAPLAVAAGAAPWHMVVIVRSQRRIANQDILLAVLAAYMGVKSEALTAAASGAPLMLVDPFTKREVRVTVADFEFLLPQQQLELVATAHILFGVHGTALQWMIAMQAGGVIVEFQFGGLGCIDGGINQDQTRILCEFGKTSLASGHSHITVRYARPDSIFLGPSPTNWDVVVDTRHFLDVIASTMCLLEKGPKGARHCQNVLNNSA